LQTAPPAGNDRRQGPGGDAMGNAGLPANLI
jgi:hypothetical protein